MDLPLVIRPARPADGALLGAVEVAAGEAFRGIGMATVADDVVPAPEAFAREAEAGRLWVAERAGEVVAYAAATVLDGCAHVEQVSVHPSAAGHGIGARLVDEIERWAAARGDETLTLTTFVDVPWNTPYYRRLGFREMPSPAPELAAALAHEQARFPAWPRVAMARPVAEPLPSSEEHDAEEAEVERVYGPWEPLDLSGLRRLLAGFDRPWWVVGGYAVDAASGRRRAHEDVDLALMASDVPALFAHLSPGWHLWSQAGGTMRPLSADRPEADARDGQVWVRRSALDPWVVDIVLTPDRDGLWVDKRDPTRAHPLDDVTWIAPDGIRYLRPEWVLFYKARLQRPKDERDLRVLLPLLAGERRAWLRDRIATTHPGHGWLERI